MSNLPMNPADDKDPKAGELEAYERKMVQTLAEAMYAVATSNNHNIASSTGNVYPNMDKVFMLALIETYKLTTTQADRVRELLTELGPNDTARDMKGNGVESYVNFAIMNTLPKGWRKMSSDALEELADKMSDDDS